MLKYYQNIVENFQSLRITAELLKTAKNTFEALLKTTKIFAEVLMKLSKPLHDTAEYRQKTAQILLKLLKTTETSYEQR